MNTKNKFSHLIFSWFSNWKYGSFALGLNFASEPQYFYTEENSFDTLKYDAAVSSIKFREYYIIFHLGFWQLSVGFSLKGKVKRIS